MAIKIRPLEHSDFPAWLPLWDGNNLGQRQEDVTAQTWSRLSDPASKVNGFGAFDGEALVGILHYIEHPTTGYIKPACYMQDVYVDPAHRQKGIGKKLVQHLTGLAQKDKKWARIHWFTDNKNEAAQALYEDIGVKLDFSLHIKFMD